MKKLVDFKEEIYKCTNCGLCQSVCPIFKETGLETAVSRGKFTLLNGILKGDVELGKNTLKYLEMCLGCNACNEFCPSGINAEEIIMAARHEYFKNYGTGFLKGLIVKSFNSLFLLKCIRLLSNLYRFFKVDKLASIALKLKIPFYKKIALANTQLRQNIKYKKLSPKKHASDLKVYYFPGCINTYANNSVKNAVQMVLEVNGINPVMPKNPSCCGIPARSAGDFDTFKKLAIKNLDEIDEDIDYLITDCASCGAAFKIYAEILDGDYAAKAKTLAQKALNINEFLCKIDLYMPENTKLGKKVTYHDPCHLGRFLRVKNEPREILKSIPGIDFVEMKDADQCCGAAGTFCVSKPDVSKAISSNKAKNIMDTNADIVATSCAGCGIGLAQGMIEIDREVEQYQPVELLAIVYSL